MDRPAAALLVVAILVLLGLILAFNGRRTLGLAAGLLSNELVLFVIGLGVIGAVAVVASQLSSAAPSASVAPSVASTPIATSTPSPPSSSGGTTHVVQAGDTLRGLARAYYGDENLWQLIYDANVDEIPNPDSLVVGRELVIPPAPSASP